MYFSLIIPVYNRPDEILELLESLTKQDYKNNFEVVVIEDGSILKCEDVITGFKEKLDISYYFKENSGPGDSRNYGMKLAKGDYFIIFDSDCIIPNNYLTTVSISLNAEFVDCFGGSDRALESFSAIQKAINFTMTSFVTTGGIRGGSEKIQKFQPRSFNMGISKEAFIASKGFGNIHPGEDPDLAIRLWKLGYKTKLISAAYVYHKRRIDWRKFYTQVNKFGKARPILNSWYPEHAKLTFVFPSAFIILLDIALILALFKVYFAILLFGVYFISIFTIASLANKSLKIGFLSLIATCYQFYGYGLGFINSFYKIHILKMDPKVAFPELFFKEVKND